MAMLEQQTMKSSHICVQSNFTEETEIKTSLIHIRLKPTHRNRGYPEKTYCSHYIPKEKKIS